MALIEAPKTTRGINSLINRLPIIGRRVEKDLALSALKKKLTRVLSEDGFTCETRFPPLGDDAEEVQRSIYVYLRGKDGIPFTVEIFAINFPETFFHLFVDIGHKRVINIHEGTGTRILPNGEREVRYVGSVIFHNPAGGYLSHRDSIDFIQKVLEAKVDREETEEAFKSTQQRLSPISSIWWNRDKPGGAFSKME